MRLWWLKRKGVPIIHRLDGIAWLHRRRWSGLRSFVTHEIRNLTIKLIHAYLADVVVYQSEFVRRWWEHSGWRRNVNCAVIHNGVDVDVFAYGDEGANSATSYA
jgi:glycosyltransferase involved in cell wall biosynthesis